jgi:hypothetical protein
MMSVLVFNDSACVRSTARERSVQTCRPNQAGLASSMGSRIKLKAALANTNSQSTFSRPRSLTFLIQAIVFCHPDAGSIRAARADSSRSRYLATVPDGLGGP